MTDLGALGPPPRRVHPEALLNQDSVAAGLMLNPLTLLGGPRALLLQIAHPLVAAGVWDHSDFRTAPFDRLLRTLSALATVAFAAPTAAAQALEELGHVHRAVTGRSPAGRAYAAADPRLATWVHATIVDSYLVVERRWMGRLSRAEREAFYLETLPLGQAFGARVGPGDSEALPACLEDFEMWMQAHVEGLEVGDQARSMAPEILHPPLSAPWGAPGRLAEHFAWPLMEALTADLLPPALSRAYGLAEGWERPETTRFSLARGRAALSGVGSRVVLAGGRVATRSAGALVCAMCRNKPRPDLPTRVAAALTGQTLEPA